MKAAVLGDEGDERAAILAALEDAGADVAATAGVGEAALREVGVPDSDAVVVIGSERATLIAVARELGQGLRIVLVADDAPDFVRGTVDLILTGELARPGNVVEAVAGSGAAEDGGAAAAGGGDGESGDDPMP